jgi:hypothetical protein
MVNSYFITYKKTFTINKESAIMDWLAENWFWVLIFVLFIAMHLFGHGHGGHGAHGSKRGQNGHNAHGSHGSHDGHSGCHGHGDEQQSGKTHNEHKHH